MFEKSAENIVFDPIKADPTEMMEQNGTKWNKMEQNGTKPPPLRSAPSIFTVWY
jgi:hypothetical protein